MSSTSVTVIATLKAKPGQEKNLEQALRALIATTRAEEGCLNYDLHVSATDPATFVFHENWRCKADLDDHLAKPHLQDFLGKADLLLAQPPDIALFNRIG